VQSQCFGHYSLGTHACTIHKMTRFTK
jgi:hypothetical protein